QRGHDARRICQHRWNAIHAGRKGVSCRGRQPAARTALVFLWSLTAMRRTLIMSITTERKQLVTMKNPPHPGLVVLQECIEPSGLTITQSAAALGVTRNTLSELVNGKRGISPEMAVRLSKVFGGSPESWLTQQAHYDLAHLRTTHIKLKRLQFA